MSHYKDDILSENDDYEGQVEVEEYTYQCPNCSFRESIDSSFGRDAVNEIERFHLNDSPQCLELRHLENEIEERRERAEHSVYHCPKCSEDFYGVTQFKIHYTRCKPQQSEPKERSLSIDKTIEILRAFGIKGTQSDLRERVKQLITSQKFDERSNDSAITEQSDVNAT